MKNQQFKTNVKCGACVAAITPEMEKIAGDSWQVDLTHPDRILTVNPDVDPKEVMLALTNSGYTAEGIS